MHYRTHRHFVMAIAVALTGGEEDEDLAASLGTMGPSLEDTAAFISACTFSHKVRQIEEKKKAFSSPNPDYVEPPEIMNDLKLRALLLQHEFLNTPTGKTCLKLIADEKE